MSSRVPAKQALSSAGQASPLEFQPSKSSRVPAKQVLSSGHTERPWGTSINQFVVRYFLFLFWQKEIIQVG